MRLRGSSPTADCARRGWPPIVHARLGHQDKKPTRAPRSVAMGQWAGDVRIVRPLARGRPGQRGAPITGAGLDPRVSDPSCTPVGIPSNSSDGEGCWGRGTAGTDAHIGLEVVRVVAVPHGRAGVVGIVDPGTAAQQLNDPPSPLNQAHRRAGDGWVSNKILAPSGAKTNSRNPTAKGKKQPRVKG